MQKYIMAFDEGTTSARCILFDQKGQVVASAQKEVSQLFPKAAWVEQDPAEIWSAQIGVATEALAKAAASENDIAAIGITNQRETTIIWDRKTGMPVYNAIVWQCRRTADMVDELRAAGHAESIREKTGLVIDPYFSATKIRWILDKIENGQERAENGELAFGTVDTWLIWNLTQGKLHITDYSNASRTMLFNINTLRWDEDILKLLNIPEALLPEVRPSAEVYGECSPVFFGRKIPIASAIGDQQGALFGQTCFSPGDAKNTYGTGAFLLMNTGDTHIRSQHGLLSTIAWGLEKDKVTYALEGSIFVAGSSVQWLRDSLRIIDCSYDTDYMAGRVDSSDGLFVVPAFSGLGAPYWDPHARGIIIGITAATTKYHVVRATLQSQAFMSHDVLEAMVKDSGTPLASLRVDGGGSKNNFMMQYQADISQTNVVRTRSAEASALGAAYLAGLACGFWGSLEEIKDNWAVDRTFTPQISAAERDRKVRNWHRAVTRSFTWAKEYEE